MSPERGAERTGETRAHRGTGVAAYFLVTTVLGPGLGGFVGGVLGGAVHGFYLGFVARQRMDRAPSREFGFTPETACAIRYLVRARP